MKTDRTLIYRYLGMPGQADSVLAGHIEELCSGMEDTLTPGHVFRAYSLKETEMGFLLAESGVHLTGNSARRLLGGCHMAVLLVATLGFAFDIMLSSASKRDMSEAVILDACASAYIETVCDEAESGIKTRLQGYLTDRFSPGYGDLPLSLQHDIIRLTDAEKRLGVHVLDSLLLTPTKTVTAVIGISDSPRPALIKGCAYCSMNKTCRFKKGNNHCEAYR